MHLMESEMIIRHSLITHTFSLSDGQDHRRHYKSWRRRNGILIYISLARVSCLKCRSGRHSLQAEINVRSSHGRRERSAPESH